MIGITCETPTKELCVDCCSSFLIKKSKNTFLTTFFHSKNERIKLGCKVSFVIKEHIGNKGGEQEPMSYILYTLACSSSSKSRTPAPSPITKPSRFCYAIKTRFTKLERFIQTLHMFSHIKIPSNIHIGNQGQEMVETHAIPRT